MEDSEKNRFEGWNIPCIINGVHNIAYVSSNGFFCRDCDRFFNEKEKIDELAKQAYERLMKHYEKDNGH